MKLSARNQLKARVSSVTHGAVDSEVVLEQYLAKNPGGYCGLGGCGVKLPEGWASRVDA